MADHEVHVTIDNSKNTQALTIVDSTASHGSYKPAPPPVIAAGAVGNFVLVADAGIYGAEGSCIYATADGQISLTYGDPIVENNYATVDVTGSSVRVSWEGKAGDDGWEPNQMPPHHSPIYLQVFVVAA